MHGVGFWTPCQCLHSSNIVISSDIDSDIDTTAQLQLATVGTRVYATTLVTARNSHCTAETVGLRLLCMTAEQVEAWSQSVH